MLAVIVLMAAAATKPLPNYKMPPARPARCRGKCANQYRLPIAGDDDPTSKDRAMAEDGSKCDVVGAQRCLSKRRVILRSTEDPVDTWRASFLPQ